MSPASWAQLGPVSPAVAPFRAPPALSLRSRVYVGQLQAEGLEQRHLNHIA